MSEVSIGRTRLASPDSDDGGRNSIGTGTPTVPWYRDEESVPHDHLTGDECMRVRIAAVQPRSHPGDDEEKNVEVALSAIRAAADRGAQIVCLPEGYPGPLLGRQTFPSLEPLGDEAKRSGMYVVAGLAEEAERPNHFFTTEVLIGPNGKRSAAIAAFRRRPKRSMTASRRGRLWGSAESGEMIFRSSKPNSATSGFSPARSSTAPNSAGSWP